MYDQEKKKSRGFGFLSFEDEASVERVTAEHYINLNGKQVEIKKAEPRGIEGGSGVGNAASLGQHNMNNNSNMNSMNMNSMNMNAGKMNDNSQCNNWGPPQTAPLSKSFISFECFLILYEFTRVFSVKRVFCYDFE